MAVGARPLGRGDGMLDPLKVAGIDRVGLRHDEAADDIVAVQQDAASGARQIDREIDRHEAAAVQNDVGDLVAADLVGSTRGQVIDVEDLDDLLDADAMLGGGHLQRIGLAGGQRVGRQPEQADGQPVRLDRTLVDEAGDVAALDEDRWSSVMPMDWPAVAVIAVSQFQASMLTIFAVLLTARTAACRRLERAALDPAGDDAALVELVDVLYRHPQRQLDRRHRWRRRRAPAARVGPLYQGIASARLDDVVALAGRDRA